MASTRIQYDPVGSPQGKNIAAAVALTLEAAKLVEQAVGVANSISGGGVTPTDLEGKPEFGITTGNGGTAYTAFNNLKVTLVGLRVSLATLDAGA